MSDFYLDFSIDDAVTGSALRTIPGDTAEFYNRAFIKSVGNVWNGVFSNEIADICYRTAISAFRDSGRLQVKDRHALTYAFLQGAFSYGDPLDALNRFAGQIPTYSWIPKALRTLCTAYGDDPTRTFTTNQVANTTLSRMYKEARANSSFRYTHEQGTFHNFALARPLFDYYGKMEIETLLPNTFRARWHPTYHRKMVELWIPVGTVEKHRGKPAFKVWTDKDWWIADASGDRVGEVMTNDYGRIPYVPLQMNRSQTIDDPYGGGLWDLAYANIIDNTIKWSGLLSTYHNSFEVWLAVNLDFGKKKGAGLAAGSMIAIDDVRHPKSDDLMQDAAPSLTPVGGNGQFPSIGEYGRQAKSDALFDIGVPDFLASRDAMVPTTATEFLIKYHGLLDKRRTDLPPLNDFEREFAEMTCTVANVDRRESLPVQLPEMTTDFADVDIPSGAEDQLKHEATLVVGGFYRLGSMFARWEGLDYAPTDEEAIRIITERRDKYAPIIPILQEFILNSGAKTAAA